MARVGRMVKEWMVEELSGRLTERPNIFLTTVNRLPAPEADALRQKLFASQSRMVVIRRTLGLRAIESLKVPGLSESLQGSLGLVLSGGDVLHVAKLLVEFVKTHEEQLAVRGAVIDGQLLDAARVKQLADLPPKPVLLAQVVGTLESPLTDVIFTIERLIGDVGWVVEQAAAKQPAAAAPAAPAETAQPSQPQQEQKEEPSS